MRRAPRTAHLEDVDEVGGELEAGLEHDRLAMVAAEAELLMQLTGEQHQGAQDVHGIARQLTVLGQDQVGIGEIRDEERVVRLDRRAQQQGPRALDAQLDLRQEARSVVEQAVRAQTERAHVAKTIEDGEGVAVLEDARTVGIHGRTGENVELVVYLDDVAHRSTAMG